MDYSKLLKGFAKEILYGAQYRRMNLICKILAIIAVCPVIVSLACTVAFYYIAVFFFKIIAAPADYLQKWLDSQKDKAHPASQVVMYLVSLPTIFSLQVTLSLSSVYFFVLWVFLMIQGYIVSFGGIKWQPYVNEASYEDDGVEYDYKPAAKVLSIFIFATCAVAVLAMFFVFIAVILLIAKAAPAALILFVLALILYVVDLCAFFIFIPIFCRKTVKSGDARAISAEDDEE